jgi:CDGSH-type Zn-finger protein
MEAKKCGCGRTKNAQGHCDGSHATPAPAPQPKKCGCGKTKNAQGHCDGSHAK